MLGQGEGGHSYTHPPASLEIATVAPMYIQGGAPFRRDYRFLKKTSHTVASSTDYWGAAGVAGHALPAAHKGTAEKGWLGDGQRYKGAGSATQRNKTLAAHPK